MHASFGEKKVTAKICNCFSNMKKHLF